MKNPKDNKDRCDHCKKWITADGHSRTHVGVGTLEGIVSPGVDINFVICGKCFEKKGFESAYWDDWVAKITASL
jgi:hypothetical protein